MTRENIALEVGAGQVGAGQVAPVEVRPAQVATGTIDGLPGEKRYAVLRGGVGGSRAGHHQHGADVQYETKPVHYLLPDRSQMSSASVVRKCHP
jgi:hypothetical protein